MKAVPVVIFESLHGKVFGSKAGLHIRTNAKTGNGYICRNPKHKPATEKQKAQTSKMKEANAYYREVINNPELCAQMRRAFAEQSQYKRFYDFVRSKILKG